MVLSCYYLSGETIKMLKFLRALFGSLVAILLLVFLWLAVPSSLFLSPVSWSYNPDTQLVTLARVVRWPGGEVQAAWSTELWTRSGRECTASGLNTYHNDRVQVVYDTPVSLTPCLSQGDHNVAGVVSWSVRVLGVLPLRSATLPIEYRPGEGLRGGYGLHWHPGQEPFVVEPPGD